MRLTFISLIVLFSIGLNAQPKPYQESLISIVHTTTFPTGKPFPKHIVKIYYNLSIIFIDESYERSDHPVKKEIFKVTDSISLQIEKADFIKLATAYRKLDFDSLYVPKIKSEDSIVRFISGGSSEEYIINTLMRVFTIGDGMERGETYSDALQKFVWSIQDIEDKYKARK